MWRQAVVFLLVGALWLGASPAPAGASPTQDRWTESELVDVIVVLEAVEEPGPMAQRAARLTGGDVGLVYEHALRGFTLRVPERLIPLIQLLPGVDYVERDLVMTTLDQDVPTGIERIFATDNPDLRIDGVDDRVDVDVAVIDTGIDLDHPDLNVVDGVTCRSTFFIGATCDGNGDDDQGHGSHVAGTIAALDNDLGVVGVAPGARLHAVKVLDARGSGSTATVIAGIDWVAARADTIEVANMSLGGPGFSQAQYDAIQNAVDQGVAFAVAAGNSSEAAAGSSPAAFDNVLTVSALADFNGSPGGGAPSTCRSDVDDTLADFSNFGSAVDLIAPGVCIRSTVPGGGYDTFSGTSMASPHAAGALALLASVDNPADAGDVAALYADLRARGNQNWSGDVDGEQEPLLDVSTIVPRYEGGPAPDPDPGPDPTPDPDPDPTPDPPPPPAATYSASVESFWFWIRTTVTYDNPAGGSTSGTWSDGSTGGCAIPAGATTCSFTSAWVFFTAQAPAFTADDGTVVGP